MANTSEKAPLAGMESRILEIPAALDSGTQIPITTIRGARPGPVVALVAGNHGYEYPPILGACRRSEA